MAAHTSSIAYLGPEGTYTHKAALFFAEAMGIDAPELVPCVSFDEVFDSVDRGRCGFGVVAKENSIEGPVTSTLDNFAFRSSSQILAEKVLDIDHCLVCAPEATIETVRTIASHPQGLAQCRRYINERFPGKQTVVTTSTAASAKMAAGDPSIAGIANRFAAETFGCKVAAEGIGDNLGNQTSFALIGRPESASMLNAAVSTKANGQENGATDNARRKTSLALWLQHDRAGALEMILSEFAYAQINLSMVQSRPLKQQLGDYMFFMEFEGSDTDTNAQIALSCLRLKLREVKVLGSYPVL